MSYDINAIGGYGDAACEVVEISDGLFDNVNSYARVWKIDELDDNKIHIDTDTMILSEYSDFSAGQEVLLHVSASPIDTDYLGNYLVAKVLLSQYGVLTLDKDVTEVIAREDVVKYYVQVVSFAHFDSLILNKGGIISPTPYDPYKYCGGILAIKCWDSLKLQGGHIDLVDCGLPANRKHLLRPLTTQESAANGESDNAKYSGQENYITAEKFLLNAGDGAAFIVAKKFIGNTNSRIGNTETHGARHCRGAENSVGVKPSNVTIKGGSTILIAAENIVDFTPKMIAKYRSVGKTESDEGAGLARCFIASNTIIPNDEGLYAYDVIANPYRLTKKLNVADFGNGTFGSMVNPRKPLNCYAQVTAINQGGHRLTLANETYNGLAPIIEGGLVLVQVIQKNNRHTEYAGNIALAKVLARNDSSITIDFAFPIDLVNYQMQVISIPQFVHFTLNENYTATPKFDGKVGGVFAIAVDNLCDLREGKVNVEGKGGAESYGANGLDYIGNAQDALKLPLGSGHGSVFILARTLTLSANTRIGAMYSGEGTGARYGGGSSENVNIGGGYCGDNDSERYGATGGGYIGGGSCTVNQGLGGSGAAGGTYEGLELERDKIIGGYGSNGADSFDGRFKGGYQGAHVMIIADKINNFSQACISTGGQGGKGKIDGINGAASYGGGGTKEGSSGGSGGFAFIYSN